jgi:hypothetical protein
MEKLRPNPCLPKGRVNPGGLGVKKNKKTPVRGEVFLLDIPFHRTSPFIEHSPISFIGGFA